MPTRNSPNLFKMLSMLMLVSLLLSACNLTNTSQSSQQTLAAIGQTQTALLKPPPVEATLETAAPTEAPPTETATEATEAPTATLEPVVHAVTPGAPPDSFSYMTDVNNWGGGPDPVKAAGGDDYNMNNLERPFDTAMKYRPDLDIVRADLAMDATFFYVTIALRDVGGENKNLNGSYGAELDLDHNGRGDYLIWANPLKEGPAVPRSGEWISEGMLLLRDANGNVGKNTPLMADPPASGSGDGYEVTLVDGSNRTGDLDAVWQRLSSDGKKIQLAVKRSAVGSPDNFMWGVIADDGFKDPAKFDYDDQFTLAEAGSPLSGPNFPVKAVNLVDTTCRSRWGFIPTGKEPGLCEGAMPKPTEKPCVASISGKFFDDHKYWSSAWRASTQVCIAGPGGLAKCMLPGSATGFFLFSDLIPGTYVITGTSTMFLVDPVAETLKLVCNTEGYVEFQLNPKP